MRHTAWVRTLPPPLAEQATWTVGGLMHLSDRGDNSIVSRGRCEKWAYAKCLQQCLLWGTPWYSGSYCHYLHFADGKIGPERLLTCQGHVAHKWQRKDSHTLLFCLPERRDPNLQERYRVGLNRIAAKEVPIEIKLVNPPILSQLQSKEPKQMFWVRARGHIGEGDMKMHCCVAAYISDYAFLGTALLPHQWQCNVHFMVSLDHSMWFHNPFRADHWMLYECESPWAGGSRGLVQGRLWRRDGILAVSCAQEGVIRVQSRVSESKL
ncbi:acyl-coenzyme A thioesterase 8 isoform X5 [Felis catus]|uniref:acyl-coenzyme A thioesterase 8 isoform X5 n=1 Tax=Felis catus TaxID=9685 RepID=UPI001D19CDEF|nr:acyl-coenzyme A thioesterase 8 isoform X5 [Felis catus]